MAADEKAPPEHESASLMPDDPRCWSRSDVESFVGPAQPQDIAEILSVLLQHGDERSLTVLGYFLEARGGSTYDKPVPSRLAARTAVAFGPPGIEFLRGQLMSEHKRLRYAPAILGILWSVAQGQPCPKDLGGRVADELMVRPVPPGTAESALHALREIFTAARVSPRAFGLVAGLLSERAIRGFGDAALTGETALLMSLLAEGSIRISRSILAEFSAMISDDLLEEHYQRFLTQHPALVDPLAAQVIPKQRLGTEHATDFAVRSHDGRWLLVEIERPHDQIFTKNGDFRERFTHAFGQVLDFQRWVDENIAYAQKAMPNIVAPRGLLVIGRRSSLTPAEDAKLRRFADNSRSIEILTYDDLLNRACSLYESLVGVAP